MILLDDRDDNDLDDMISGMSDIMSNDVGGPSSSTSSMRLPQPPADDAINDLDDMLNNMGSTSSSSAAAAGGGLFDDEDPFMM